MLPSLSLLLQQSSQLPMLGTGRTNGLAQPEKLKELKPQATRADPGATFC